VTDIVVLDKLSREMFKLVNEYEVPFGKLLSAADTVQLRELKKLDQLAWLASPEPDEEIDNDD